MRRVKCDREHKGPLCWRENRAPLGQRVLDAWRCADRLRVPEARFQVPVAALAAAARLKIRANVRRDLLTDDNGFLSAASLHFFIPAPGANERRHLIFR